MSSHKGTAAAHAAPKRPAALRSAKNRRRASVAEASPISQGELDVDAVRLAAAIDAALADGHPDRLSSLPLQSLMAAMCRLYGAQVDAGADHLPIPAGTAVAPTDVMVTCGALLRAANLQVFELGMWQSFTGR